MIFFHTASALAPVTMLVAEMAPGLTSGFISGAPVPTTVRTAFDGDDRVEARAGRVDADLLLDRLEPLLLDDLRHREDLRDRLDRDLGLHVAGGVDLAVGGHHGDAEQVRVDLGQRRDVVGVLAFLECSELRVGRVDGLLDLSRCLRARVHRQRHDGDERSRRRACFDDVDSSLSSKFPREVVLERELHLDAVALESVREVLAAAPLEFAADHHVRHRGNRGGCRARSARS